MTQEEVDLIYDYLHEYYEYKEGLFIKKINNNKLDGFCNQSGKMRATLHINKKNYFIRYASLVWIYHYKNVFYSYNFKDGNPTNNKIENLIPLNTIEHSYVKRITTKGYREVLLKNGSIKYMAETHMNGLSHTFGRHNTKEEAITAYSEAKKLWVIEKFPPEKIKEILINKGFIPVKEKKQTKEKKIKKGYIFDKRDNKYYAYHYVNKKRISLGSYYNAEDANKAYLKAKEQYAKDA
ncbi:MAG TPA: hypothetical protein VGO21_05745 [Candidatus Paceibacterota bacterium]|nr:hypothetical protein [Candidatus Paceibacterota bacterium]